jgi:hypothetical protein
VATPVLELVLPLARCIHHPIHVQAFERSWVADYATLGYCTFILVYTCVYFQAVANCAVFGFHVFMLVHAYLRFMAVQSQISVSHAI